MAYFTILMSLIISVASAYCTVSGMGKIFAGATLIAMLIASVIECGRVTLVYNLHHFWNKLDFIKRITGITMLIIACSISAMGIFGFLSNAHIEKSISVQPIVQEIKGKEAELEILNQSVANYKTNLEELKTIYDANSITKGSEELIKRGYITKAFNFKKEQQQQYNEVFKKISEEQQKIVQLNSEITVLKQEVDKVAPELGPLKYVMKLFHAENQDTAIIIFIVMIMCVFDTLAIYLMIMGDWISLIKTQPVKKEEVKIEPIDTSEEVDELIQKDTDIQSIINLIKNSNNLYDKESFNEFLINHPSIMKKLKTIMNTDDKDILNQINKLF